MVEKAQLCWLSHLRLAPLTRSSVHRIFKSHHLTQPHPYIKNHTMRPKTSNLHAIGVEDYHRHSKALENDKTYLLTLLLKNLIL